MSDQWRDRLGELNAIRALFPIGSRKAGAELTVCESNFREVIERNAGRLALWLTVWGPRIRSRRVGSIASLGVLPIPAKAFCEWRFWFALKGVLADVLKTYDQIEHVRVGDLFEPAWSALDLRSMDYDKALRRKSRLGKFLVSL